WAVGNYYFRTENASRTQILHWDGSQWSAVPSPNSGTDNNYLYAAAATSANDVWAAGSYVASSGNTQTLIEHWNGSQWAVVSSPNSGVHSFLNALTATSANDAWAAGGYVNVA